MCMCVCVCVFGASVCERVCLSCARTQTHVRVYIYCLNVVIDVQIMKSE